MLIENIILLLARSSTYRKKRRIASQSIKYKQVNFSFLIQL